MQYTQLSSSEIQDLISRYNSELKKLQFQTEEIKNTIQQLENLLKTVASHEKAALNRMSEQRKKEKSLSAITGKKRRGRPPKNKTAPPANKPLSATEKKPTDKKGYKLSVWDQYVIDSIHTKGRVAISQEIIDLVEEKNKAEGKPVDAEEVRKKVTRSLQKLVNRRGDLAKVAYPGKGFAYALPEWLKGKRVAAQYKFKPLKKG